MKVVDSATYCATATFKVIISMRPVTPKWFDLYKCICKREMFWQKLAWSYF